MNRPDEERDVAPKWIGRGYFTTTGKRLSNEWFAALEGASEVNKNRGYQNIPHARPGPHVRAHQSFRATVAPGPRSGRLRAVTSKNCNKLGFWRFPGRPAKDSLGYARRGNLSRLHSQRSRSTAMRCAMRTNPISRWMPGNS